MYTSRCPPKNRGASVLIRLTLDDLMGRRQISVEELSRRTGVSRENLSRLRSGRTRGIRFETLAALCEALAGCVERSVGGVYRRVTRKQPMGPAR